MKLAALALVAVAGCNGVTLPSSDDPPGAPVPAWAHQQRFAITDNRSDELSFVSVDQAQPMLYGNLPVGDIPVELEGPHHLAASPDGKFIYYNLSNYVPGSGKGPHGSHGTGLVPGSLVKIDSATAEKVAEVLIDRSPGDVVLNKAGTFAYVTHYDLVRVQQALADNNPTEALSTLAIVDTTTMKRLSLTPLCVTSHGEGLSPDEKTLYATCALTDELAVVDVSDPAHPNVTARVPVGPNPNTNLGVNGQYGPYALTVNPKDGTVWISDNNSGDVRVYDPGKQAMDAARVFPTGGVVMFGDFSADQSQYFVPHQGDDQVTVIDTMTNQLVRTVPTPQGFCLNMHALRVTPDGQRALLICEGDHINPGTIAMLTTKPLAFTGYVSVGVFPDGAAWLPPAP